MDTNYTNPWAVKDLEEFSYFCCPECNVKEKSEEIFLKHALQKHPHCEPHLPFYIIKQETYHPDHIECDVEAFEDLENIENDDEKKIIEEHVSKKDENQISRVVRFNVKSTDDARKIRINPLELKIPEETKKQKHECKQCKKSYPRMKDLKMHVRRTHETASQTHKCPNCEKSYSHVHDLKVHIRKVHEGFRHNCHLCDKSYTESGNLKKHIKTVHEEIRIYSCDNCGKAFGTPEEIKIHVKTVHEGKKYHKCDLCVGMYASETDLRNHIKKVHEGVKYSCHICNKTFTEVKGMKKHVRVVHEKIKDYDCKICGKAFGYKNSFNMHMEICTRKNFHVPSTIQM